MNRNSKKETNIKNVNAAELGSVSSAIKQQQLTEIGISNTSTTATNTTDAVSGKYLIEELRPGMYDQVSDLLTSCSSLY